MDIAIILSYKYKGSEWTLNGEDYKALKWISKTPKPSEEELESQWAEVQQIIQAEQKANLDSRQSLLAKLAALGLTEQEIAAL
jgi:hypothetical protein